MKFSAVVGAALVTATVLAGCGGGGAGTPTTPPPPADTFVRGALVQSPPALTAQLSAGQLRQRLETGALRDEALLAVAGDPVCGVEVRRMQYTTLGAQGERTQASGALMLPAGGAPGCTGERPMLLYAHATNPAKSYNLAALGDSSNPAANESLLLAAMFAARGYIVVAPNYAGYDGSTLPYHPFLHAQQQSGEMRDALAAARSGLPSFASGVRAGSKLFLAGYSQGGHVALATQRALQQAGDRVTASVPMSGPYLLSRQLDDIFAGQVSFGSTLFTSLLATGYQRAYGDLYAHPAQLFGSPWSGGIDTLFPGATARQMVDMGQLPELAMFSSTPPTAPAGSGLQATLNAMTPATDTGTGLDAVFARGFGTTPLFTNAARLAYLQDLLAHPAAPTHPLRIAARANDIPNDWAPNAPVLLCGGAEDATVAWRTHALGLAARWALLPPGRVNLLDVDAQPAVLPDPFVAERLGFAAIKEATVGLARLEGKDPQWEVARNYHAAVLPFCASAARRFFDAF